MSQPPAETDAAQTTLLGTPRDLALPFSALAVPSTSVPHVLFLFS